MWTLKHVDPESHIINMGLKNMSDVRAMFYKDHVQRDLYQQIHVLTDILTKFFRLKVVLIITQL